MALGDQMDGEDEEELVPYLQSVEIDLDIAMEGKFHHFVHQDKNDEDGNLASVRELKEGPSSGNVSQGRTTITDRGPSILMKMGATRSLAQLCSPEDKPPADPAHIDDSTEPVEATPVPVMRVFILCILLMCDGISTYILFPFVAYMIVDFGLVDDVRESGYYAGFLVSAFAGAQFCSSFFWGRLSDKKGRRPVILGGMTGTVIAMFVFGMSQNIWMAIASRSIHGLLNGNVGVIKTYLGEITDSTNKARSFSAIGFAAGFGRLIGPLIGGLLYKPIDTFPGLIHKGSLFDTHPHLLPCLVGNLFSITGITLGFFFLKETLVLKTKRKSKKKYARLDGETGVAHSDDDTIATDSDAMELQVIDSVGDDNELRSLDVGAASLDDDGMTMCEEGSSGAQFSHNDDGDDESDEEREEVGIMTILMTKEVFLSCGCYGILGWVTIMYDELFTLLIETKASHHGLGFTAAQVGYIGCLAGICMISFQILIYPRIANRFGPLMCFRFAALGLCPLFTLFPNFTYITTFHNDLLTYLTLVPFVVWRFWFGITCFTSIFILISNSCENRYLGQVNGMGQSLVALGRALGPGPAAWLYSYTVVHLDYRLMWLFIGTFTAVMTFMAFKLDRDKIDPKPASKG
eukprot:TRINITY_DN6048_c0_g1_i1.p1 TRINITY_DN6048_c0_g1~~TRINITY_DN6048_c0_g1_i1.p1  ORF type:complete len:632 (+),score=102.18 TRINITY_DN6048_c0_g1_i1:238-2133(+)